MASNRFSYLKICTTFVICLMFIIYSKMVENYEEIENDIRPNPLLILKNSDIFIEPKKEETTTTKSDEKTSSTTLSPSTTTSESTAKNSSSSSTTTSTTAVTTTIAATPNTTTATTSPTTATTPNTTTAVETQSNSTTTYLSTSSTTPATASTVKLENATFELIRDGLTDTSTFAQLIDYQRKKVEQEMKNFKFPLIENGNETQNLKDFTPETGGTPIRSLILTSWRSGSTFFGDILNSMPGNFYHYEPLMTFGTVQIRNDKTALERLQKLLKCNYTDMYEYFSGGKNHEIIFSHNTRLWSFCQLNQENCFKPEFLEPFCKLFPHQSMKIVRLRANLSETLLTDSSLNVKIVLLVRDPRGIMQSRKYHDWCFGNADCSNYSVVCGDMVSDYHAAGELLRKYPNKFKVVRYEDLAIESHHQSREILNFYGLPFDEAVKKFLDTHTKANEGDKYSTFRNSESVAFNWTKKNSFTDVEEIQHDCKEAMKLWGYKPVANESELFGDFYPLLPFPKFT
jgi:hypothetical protein